MPLPSPHVNGLRPFMSAEAPPGAWARWQLAVHEVAAEGPLCLALTNTRHWRHASAPVEYLHTFADLVQFARVERIVDADEAAALTRTAERDGPGAQAEHDATLQLREALFRLFAAQARRAELPRDDVARLTACFDAAVQAFAFDLRAGRLLHLPRAAPGRLDVVRLQCAVSAVALLCGTHARKVKECADDRGCGRLFVDLTRNRSRRYCLSAECGNRARQAAFRERHKPLTRPSGTLSPHAGRGKG
jgi:predicted RNA-binding Zn ribbon-like protein